MTSEINNKLELGIDLQELELMEQRVSELEKYLGIEEIEFADQFC